MTTAEQAGDQFSREPTTLVSLTVDGDIAGSQTFYFSPQQGRPLNLQLDLPVLAYLDGVGGRPTRVQPDAAVTERASITASFLDDTNAPPFDPAVFTVIDGSTFWHRLELAQPDLVGSRMEIFRGYVEGVDVPSFKLGDFQKIFRGRVEDFGWSDDGLFNLTAKDDLALADRQTPSQISETNLVDGSVLAADPTIGVDDGIEITDPTALPSRDFFPVCLELDPDTAAEVAIVKSRTIGVVTIQDNFADKSEDFSDAAWTKTGGTTVTPNTRVGPWGGDARADQLDFAVATTDNVEQDTGDLASGKTYTFSVWLRALAAATITLELELDDSTELAQAQVSVTTDWARYEVTASFTGGAGQTAVCRINRDTGDGASVVAWGAQVEIGSGRGNYAATDGNAGDDAGRGAFGTTAAAHADDVAFNECIAYRSTLDPETGVHPVVVERDLVNRGAIAVVDVDQSSFDGEFSFIESPQFKRTGATLIRAPESLADHVTEVRAQGLLDLWVSEEGKVKTRLSFRQNLPGVTVFEITDEANIVRRGSSYEGNKESRVTRAQVYFNPVAGETDPGKPEDFLNVIVTVDLAVEAASGPKIKNFFSKWIFRSAEVTELGGRLLSRFKRGAKIGRHLLDLKDATKFLVGDVIQLDSPDIPRASGTTAVRAKTQWQVVHKEHNRAAGQVRVETLEFSGLRYGIISPNEDLETAPSPFPDYDDASGAEKQYGFIGDANNQVGTPAEDGYYIL